MAATASAFDLDAAALAAAVRECGGEAFRARQVGEWLYARRAASWGGMSNIPKALRAALAERLLDLDGTLETLEVAGTGGGTRKVLSRLADGELAETVLIPARDRATVCVSSQVGCAMGCAFCASGKNGCARNLSAGEIAAQAARAAVLLGRRPDNVVFMGMGEPFANYDNALAAARRMNAPPPEGFGIGARRITFSTCGVVPGIERFAREGVQFELSVSLHAPTDAMRSALMPVNARWPLGVLIPAVRAYTEATGRIVTFEYTLVAGWNDAPEHARALLALVRGFPCRVNLIPLNPVPGFAGRAPDPARCEAFRALLERHGLNATLRRSKGRGVNASCGQLRRARAAGGAPARA
ncbi:MAG: 23S rRNA (adenine(2503)-C(2))-methyltransferase RlmN [Kiritimatiellae bacterium]|nr:23S rRNA (adenine(2503)-C(2))-methyltransferase RlmN [Kiritimatiellia bacterium]